MMALPHFSLRLRRTLWPMMEASIFLSTLAWHLHFLLDVFSVFCFCGSVFRVFGCCLREEERESWLKQRQRTAGHSIIWEGVVRRSTADLDDLLPFPAFLGASSSSILNSICDFGTNTPVPGSHYGVFVCCCLLFLGEGVEEVPNFKI